MHSIGFYFRKGKKALNIAFQYCLHFGRKRGICLSENTRRLYSYQNKYHGKRCFVIGNGPSLTPEDLERLQDEYTFGCNVIYKIYGQTNWRPTFHCLTDKTAATELGDALTKQIECPFFINKTAYKIFSHKPEETIYVRDFIRTPYRPSKRFLSYYSPSDSTVVSFMLELAIYMGFKEIYLLGVDCTNVFAPDGHFTKDYLPETIKEKDVQRITAKFSSAGPDKNASATYQIKKSIYAFQQLKAFAKTHNCEIFNATRGGNLEVFKRVDFDQLIS